MRAGQPFAMRYPLIEVEGSYGNLQESGNWAASRYTSSRLSELSEYLFKDIEKNTIQNWLDNYDDTEQYPSVLPSKGFFNIVNGTNGIGIGAASSCPQFNINDINNSLITLLWNPDATFEEIYCAPDFATGAFLLNEKEVKESLKKGYGASCKLRAKVEFNQEDRSLIVSEIPYGVYTNTICGELEKIINSEDNIYIDRFNDLTGVTPLIKIYLKKTTNVNKAIKFLYKNTSLQSHYGINLTVLEDGRYPKVYGWKDILLSFLEHQRIVYTKAFEYELKKLKDRLHIVEGILIALARIEEVIEVIKTSKSTAQAAINLQNNFLLSEIQAKAVLDIKLARLAHLEVEKFEEEKKELLVKINNILTILNDETLFKKEIEKDLVFVKEKFGDSRRTVIMNIENDEEKEPIEIKNLVINLTNKNNIFVEETSNLYTQKRGGRGSKFKLQKDEVVINTNILTTTDILLFFTEKGNCYNLSGTELPIGEKTMLEALLSLSNEKVCTITVYNKNNINSNTIIFTKNGFMKKTLTSEYITRKKSLKALNLEDGDKVVSVLFNNNDRVGILTKAGRFLVCGTKDVRAVGRVSKGVRSIKLDENDYVISAKNIFKETDTIATISKMSYCKRTPISDFPVAGRYTKGGIIQSLKDGDEMANFEPLTSKDKNGLIVSTTAQIKMNLEEIPILNKKTLGVKTIKLPENERIIAFVKI